MNSRRFTGNFSRASKRKIALRETYCTAGFLRLSSRYRTGRTRYWLKCKNPDARAVRREAEEEWGKSGGA